MDEQRLGQPGDANEQRVAAGEERGDEIVHDIALSYDPLRDLRDEGATGVRQLVEQWTSRSSSSVAAALGRAAGALTP